MGFYDIAMLVVLVGCTLFGAWKGMAWQLASLGSMVFSYLVALKFSSVLAPMITISEQEPLNRVIAMLILYVATSVVIWLGFRVVAGAIDRVKLREFDRQLGALFGAFKGALFCMVITFFAVTMFAQPPESVVNSQSGLYITLLIDKAHPLVPEEVHDVLHPYVEKLRNGLQGGQEGALADGHNHDHEQGGQEANVETDSLEQMFADLRSIAGRQAAPSENAAAASGLDLERMQQIADSLSWLQSLDSSQAEEVAASANLTGGSQELRERTGQLQELLNHLRNFAPPENAAAPLNSTTR